jgi:hypothetical protein
MSDGDGPLGLPADIPEPIRIPGPPGGFGSRRKPKRSQPRRGSRVARLPVVPLIRGGVVIVVAAIVVLVIVIVIIAVGQH